MTVDLTYFLDGEVYKLPIEPTQYLLNIPPALYQNHQSEFERRGRDVVLYAPSNLKREELPERINDIITSERPLILSLTSIGEFFGEKLHDETLVHLVAFIGQPRGSLEGFLGFTTYPARSVNLVEATSTHPYDTSFLLIDRQDVPYRLVKFVTMADSMTDDLFNRVLPRHSITSSNSLEIAKELARAYLFTIAPQPVSHESSVWMSTHDILKTCTLLIEAVGFSYTLQTEETNTIADVRVDSVVHVWSSKGTHGGVAVEDKSPAVYDKHCSDFEVDRTCGELQSRTDERDFRGTLFQLVIYMMCEKLRWGIIHSGVKMRIVRVEHKEGRPYVIISGEIPVGSRPPRSIYSLVCYMLLTVDDDELHIFDGIKVTIPAPPPIHRLARPRQQTRESNLQRISEAPGNSSSVVVHTTAAAGTKFLDIPMQRVDKLPMSSGDAGKIDVYITDFLGAGGFGRVFRGDLFTEDEKYCGLVIMKLARPGLEDYLSTEAAVYRMLHDLCGTCIPRYYGHFSGEANGFRYSCILVSYCGEALKTFDDLSLSQRMAIFRILWKVHQAGVVHEDIRPSNVLQSGSDIRLTDFSTATLNHQCEGVGLCKEISGTARMLGLASLPL